MNNNNALPSASGPTNTSIAAYPPDAFFPSINEILDRAQTCSDCGRSCRMPNGQQHFKRIPREFRENFKRILGEFQEDAQILVTKDSLAKNTFRFTTQIHRWYSIFIYLDTFESKVLIFRERFNFKNLLKLRFVKEDHFAKRDSQSIHVPDQMIPQTTAQWHQEDDSHM